MVLKNNQLTDRAIYVYLPTVDMADEWKSKADKASLSVSKFVIEHVENSLKQEDERKGSFASRAELLKHLEEKEEENVSLKNENRMLKMLADNFDKELKKYRARPFLEYDTEHKGRTKKFQGIREYDKELIQLLKEQGTIDSDRILKELGIRPKDTDLVKAISRQLELLQEYRLVAPTVRGWRWVE